MSWDPNQPQGQPPSGPNPYDPSQSPPQNPYQQPPSQYAPPLQNPYEQPSGANVYGQPYVAPGYQQAGYGYPPQAQNPLPLGQALGGLPNQYLKILTKPGAQSFIEEQGKADWGIILVQLLIIGLIGTIIGLIGSAVGFLANPFSSGNAASSAMGFVIASGASTFSIVSVFISFFITVGIQYSLAKAFKGVGNFKQQAYNQLLFYSPIAVINYVLGIIPILGFFLAFALSIYQIVLNVFSIMATHRLSGGKATAVVLIPYAVLFLVALLCVLALVALFFHAASTLPTTP